MWTAREIVLTGTAWLFLTSPLAGAGWIAVAEAGESNLDLEMSDPPDLTEALGVFRRHAALMGECPMGLDAAGQEDVPPGSHLLHLGTTGFYLDYKRRLGLTEPQVVELTSLRDASLRGGGTFEPRIEAAEQRLWTLTAAWPPDPASVKTQIEAVVALEAEQRWTYVEALIRAAAVLTPEQRATLAGP